MIKTIKISTRINLESEKTGYNLKYENEHDCPYCGNANITNALYAYAPSFSDGVENTFKYAYCIFECAKCKHVFISIGRVVCRDTSTWMHISEFFIPERSTKRNFSDEIKTLSPDFVDVYNKALAIENRNDIESAGMIYRKSLEYLIYDYLTKCKSIDISSIKVLTLGQVIQEFLRNDEDGAWESVATLANWIGNDFTHVNKRNSDLNIEDLKQYLNIAVNMISLEIQKTNAITMHKSRK